MKKTIFFTICLVFVIIWDCLSAQPLANENKTGLYVRSIDQILRLDPDEIDVAIAALIVSEEWSDLVQGRRYQTDLEDMAYELRQRIEEQNLNGSYRAIEIINSYLFEELGFNSVDKAHKPEDLFLHTVMDNRQGYCLSLSILYLSIGERLGLPLYGVVVPSHFFIRYDDGNIRFNIETTAKGGLASDEHYIDKFKVGEVSRDSLYMKNLNKMQVLGCLFNNLGNVYIEVGNMEKAQLALERSVQINPTLAESHTNLGNVYLKKGMIRNAIMEYESALDINPNQALIHNNLGNAYLQQGWLSYAVSEYQHSIRLDPDFLDGYKNLALAYAKDKQLTNAISILNQAVVINPDDEEIYILLGNFYQQNEKYQSAIKEYNKVFYINNNSPQAYYGIGNAYIKLDEVEKGISSLKKALQYQPDMVEALTSLGNIFFSQGDYSTAMQYYQKALTSSPNDKNLHFNLGSAHYNLSDYASAVIEYAKAVRIDPQMAEAQKGLAMAYLMLEKYDLAQRHITIAQKLGAEVSEDLLESINKHVTK